MYEDLLSRPLLIATAGQARPQCSERLAMRIVGSWQGPHAGGHHLPERRQAGRLRQEPTRIQLSAEDRPPLSGLSAACMAT